MALRIQGKLALALGAIIVLFVAVALLAQQLSHDAGEEIRRVGEYSFPTTLHATSLLDVISDMNVDVLDYARGEPGKREQYSATYEKFTRLYAELESSSPHDHRVAQIGRLMARIDDNARSRLFDDYDPNRERWARERMANLERRFSGPLEPLLDHIRVTELALGTADSDEILAGLLRREVVYSELIAAAESMRRALYEYLDGVADARSFTSEAETFELQLAEARSLSSDPDTEEGLNRVASLFEGLRRGATEIIEGFDPAEKRAVTSVVDEMASDFAELESLVEDLAQSSQERTHTSLAAVQQRVQTNQRLVLLTLLLALGLAAGVTAFADRAIARPIRELRDVMDEISSGNNEAIVSHTDRRDEVGEMARTVRVFKENARALAEKTADLEAMPAKLGKYLSPQVYSSIFRGRTEVQVRAKRKKLTVFFSDLVGFTLVSSALEPEETAAVLNNYLTEMTRIALEHGATIDKYIGDGIMAFFGDPESDGVVADAQACVRMALAMQRRMSELADEWSSAGHDQPLQCRIGIHTGFCDVGNFGSDQHLDYTIIGQTVNLANRLEGITEPGGITLSHETWALTKDLVRAEPGTPVQLKGIPREVVPYRVVRDYQDPAVAERVIRTRARGVDLLIDLDELERISGDGGETSERTAVIEGLESALRTLRKAGR